MVPDPAYMRGYLIGSPRHTQLSEHASSREQTVYTVNTLPIRPTHLRSHARAPIVRASASTEDTVIREAARWCQGEYLGEHHCIRKGHLHMRRPSPSVHDPLFSPVTNRET
jgi:hypothetical protein